ncbi:pheromone A receptor-domain-containing protein [Cerioporus squamosus]|nr:pheromone A receptor-domain-containing protein [Cerioporus squamosus]
MDPTYPAFPVVAFIALILVLLPLPWHLQAWNSGTCLFMFWTALTILNLFVNSIVWHGNALNPAPIWCDISSRIIIAGTVAVPAASLCINRRLYQIASVRTVSLTRADKRRAVIEDLCIGLGIPLIEVVMSYVVSGHRYDIYEDIGCQPAIYNTPVAYALVLCWPIVIGLASGAYCFLSLLAFNKRRAQFAEFMSSHSALTVNRYFRLMAIATTDLLFSVPISAYGIYLNVAQGEIFPWISWDDTHFQFWKVYQVPAAVWRSNRDTLISVELSRWLVPFCAFVFFAFFGFASEARAYYARIFKSLLKGVGLDRLRKNWISQNDRKALKLAESLPSSMHSAGSMPVFYSRPPPPPFSNLSFDKSFKFPLDAEKSSVMLSPTPTYQSTGHDLPDVPETPRSASTQFSDFTIHGPHAV